MDWSVPNPNEAWFFFILCIFVYGKYIYIYSDKRFLQSTFYTNKKIWILYQILIPEIL